MKTKLATVLSQCRFNKTLEQQTALSRLIKLIDDDRTDNVSINYNNNSIYISLWYDKVYLYSVMFTSSNLILCSLPSDISQTYVIENDKANMQYSDIRVLLNSN